MQYIKINSIKKLQRVETVYNFSVEKLENYVANGVVAHNCYVKEKEAQFGSSEMALPIWYELIQDIVCKQEHIATKQVTFALDTLNWKDVSAWNKMYSLASMYFKAVRDKAEDLQAHITVNCISDLKEYTDRFGVITNIDLLSISNINKLQDITEARELVPGALINWNVMSATFAAKSIDQVQAITRKVDSIYMLLHKAPLGSTGHDFASFFAGLKQIAGLQPVSEVPERPENACAIPPLSAKIMLDGCMSDAIEFNKKGHGCASNISRFQIWPDGRVTGCAYNSHNQYGKNALCLTDILDNLKDARNRYEFKQCSIPQGLIDLGKKRHLEIANA